MSEHSGAERLRLAIVGCGAVTELLHLPALAGSAVVVVTALVDPDAGRRDRLARALPGVHSAPSTADLKRHADAAIVAVPHHLHREIASDLLERGLHVFVEKPLATTLGDADALIAAAARAARQLGVGLVRRQYSTFRFVTRVLEAGWLGTLRTIDWREGGPFAWPIASPAQFRREQGGGVLLDTGAHSLDTLLAWLGPFDSVAYRDDERGGVDANCTLDLVLRSGVTGIVELSRTRDLRNTCIITGTGGELEVGFAPDSPVSLRIGGASVTGSVKDAEAAVPGVREANRRQIEAFAEAVRAGTDPPVPASAARESVRLFDACRRVRQPLELPWEPFGGDADWGAFDGSSVLVLGATGFIGGRLVEALTQHAKARVRVLVRDLSKLADVARHPVQIVHGDVGDRAALAQAMAGCDVVVNCTWGKGSRPEQQRVNVDAVRALVETAHECGVRRVVHTSTVSVYGVVNAGALDESSESRAPKSDDYGFTKWMGEETALEVARRLGVPLVVVQPTTVYGPGAPSWTLRPIGLLKSGSVVLVDEGRGVSNAVYVDDVVTALLRAALSPEGIGKRMLIGGPDVVTWREFFGAYDRILNTDGLVSMSAEQIETARRERQRQNGNIARLRMLLREEYERRGRFVELPILTATWNLARRIVPRRHLDAFKRKMTASPGGPALKPPRRVHLPTRQEEEFFRATSCVESGRAAKLIGYSPRLTFEQGMTRVAEWTKWANLA